MNFARSFKNSFALRNFVSLDKCVQRTTCLRFYCDTIQAESPTEFQDIEHKKLYSQPLIDEIFKNVQDKHLYTRANHKIVDFFRLRKIAYKDTLRILSTNVELLILDESDLVGRVKLLKEFGFKEKAALSFLATHINVTEPDNMKHLRKVVAEIRIAGISERECRMMLQNNVSLLTARHEQIKIKLKNLKSVFANSDARAIAVNCPNTLTDDMEETKAKIEYAYNKMGISKKNMLNCNLLQHSLKDIIARHKFLEKKGMYTKPDPHQHSVVAVDGGNPALKAIFRPHLGSFCTSTANSTLEEFMAFKELLEVEEHEKRLEKKDVDDENDDDDEEYDDDDDEKEK